VTKRNQILLAVVAGIAAIGAFWFLVLSPKREQLAKLDADIAKQETARDQADAQAAEYEKSKASYKANYARVVRLGKAVPADDDVRSLLVQVEDAARRNSVDFRVISVGDGGGPTGIEGAPPPTPGSKTVPGSDIAVLPFKFGFTGRFFSLADFLGKVESFVKIREDEMDAKGRLLLLTSFSLKPDQTGFPKLRAEIGATTYVTPATTGPPTGRSAGAGTAPGTEQPAADAGTAAPDPSAAPASPAAPTTPTTATATGAVR
jgi:Tfp pilus assembly protein PilO